MRTENVNIHQKERTLSIILGGFLLIRSITHPSLSSALVAAMLLYRGIRGHSYLYQSLNISTADRNKRLGAGTSESALEVVRSITIGKPAQELYQLWREPETLSHIMGNFGEVRQVENNRQHWMLQGPFKQHVEWESQIIEDQPGKLLSWQSLDGSPLPNEGSLSFQPAPKDWGTEVKLRFHFDPPGGDIGNIIGKRLNIVTRLLAEKVLRRYKSLAETGEIPTLEHNPAARTSTYAHA